MPTPLNPHLFPDLITLRQAFILAVLFEKVTAGCKPTQSALKIQIVCNPLFSSLSRLSDRHTGHHHIHHTRPPRHPPAAGIPRKGQRTISTCTAGGGYVVWRLKKSGQARSKHHARQSTSLRSVSVPVMVLAWPGRPTKSQSSPLFFRATPARRGCFCAYNICFAPGSFSS